MLHRTITRQELYYIALTLAACLDDMADSKALFDCPSNVVWC